MDCTLDEKRLRRSSAKLVTLTIVQLLLLLVLAISWRIHLEPPPVQISMYCVTCNDIKQTYPYTDTDTGNVIYAWRQTYNHSICCGPIHEVMALRMQNEMAKQNVEKGQANPSLLVGESLINDCEWQGIKSPTAKLVGVVDSVPSDIVQGHSKLRWNKNGRTFTVNICIHLELEGEIFIKRPGYYILSSTLNVNTTGTNITTTIFSHHVNLLSHKFGTTSILIQSQRSINESNNGVFTSFISAVFKLHMYDRISVSVSNPNYLARHNSNDHFTAYYTYDKTYIQ